MLIPGKWTEAFDGASAVAAGGKGAVPAPAAGQQMYLLAGDGTWTAPSWGTGVGGPFEGIHYYTGQLTSRTISTNTQDTTGSVFYYDDLTINSSITWSFASPSTGSGGGLKQYYAPLVLYVLGTLWLKSNAKILVRNGFIASFSSSQGFSYSAGAAGSAGNPGGNAGTALAAGNYYPWYHSAGGGGGGGGSTSSDDGGDALASEGRCWDMIATGGAGSAGLGGFGGLSGGLGGPGSTPIPYSNMRRDPHLAHGTWAVFGSAGAPGGGGAGGTSGGGNGALGGDGGATAFIYCRNLKLESGASIDCSGEDGSDGANALGGGGGGAGGGGGGGAAHVMYGDLDSSNAVSSQTTTLVTLSVSPSGSATIDARGGDGGSGGSSSSYGDGGDGGDGEDGVVTFLRYTP